MAVTAIADFPVSGTNLGAPPGSSSVTAIPGNPTGTTNVDKVLTDTILERTVDGGLKIGDSVDDTMVLKGRVSTSTVAGAGLGIDSTYLWGEGQELRYTISSWAGTGNQFNGIFLRAQNDLDNASGSLRGAEIMAVANGSAVSDMKGCFSEAYIKGDTTETIDTVYGLHAEVSFDASRSNSITLTEATPLLSKILSGKVADYTKFHGAIFRFGDMDGGSRTFGDGIQLVDDTGTSGTCVLTNGINLNIGATTGVLIGGATTTAVSVTGNATDAFKTATGTFTNGVNIGGTVTTGVLISGATTTAISVTGNATDAFKAGTGTFTNGVNLGGTLTTGITAGACTTLVASTGAIGGHILTFAADSTAVVSSGASASIPANTGYLLMKVGSTTFRIPVYANS